MDKAQQDALKKKAAEAALAYIKPGMIVGVGSGSTVRFFIEALGAAKISVPGYVPSSNNTAKQLRELGLNVIDIEDSGRLPVYVDGADEIDPAYNMIKGGGAALTREKIVASAADTFVCICDASKEKAKLGAFALPVECIPFAQNYVKRRLIELGGKPKLREGCITDNGCVIFDTPGLDLSNPPAVERDLNNIPGVLENGIFAARRADVLVLATEGGIVTKKR